MRDSGCRATRGPVLSPWPAGPHRAPDEQLPGTVLLLGRLARSFLGAQALQDQLHFHFQPAVGMFYSAGTRGESVLLQATDLRVKEAMGVGGSSMASSPLFQYLLWFGSLPLFSVTVGPWLPQHAHVSLKPPRTHAARPWGRWPWGGSSRWRKHSPAISCSLLGHSYQPTSPSLQRQCCSSCIRARKSQPQLNSVFYNPPEREGLGL